MDSYEIWTLRLIKKKQSKKGKQGDGREECEKRGEREM